MKIAFLGDFGHYPKSLEKMMEDKNFDKLFVLGDNFYPRGLETKKQLTRASRFFKDIDSKNIFPVLGNHDWDGDVNGELKYGRWTFDTFFYLKKVNRNTGIWMLDSQILDPHNPMFPLSGKIDEVSGDHEQLRKDQIRWLKHSLEESKDLKNKIFVTHYPLISAGIYPTNDVLIETLGPLMKKYKVKTVISGHDHSAQHLKMKFRGYTIHQFISAAGDSPHPGYKHVGTDTGVEMFFGLEPCYLRLDDSSMKFKFVDVKDKKNVRYEVNV